MVGASWRMGIQRGPRVRERRGGAGGSVDGGGRLGAGFGGNGRVGALAFERSVLGHFGEMRGFDFANSGEAIRESGRSNWE